MSSTSVEYPWFAIMVKSRHEKAVSAALRGKGYPEYLPLVQKIHWSSGHKRTAEVPVLPNYVFSRFNPFDRLPVLTVPGVLSVVRDSAGPLAVDEQELESFRRLCETAPDVSEHPFGEPGTPVELVSGPLSGVTGTLVAAKGHHRLVVAISLLQRAISVEVDRNAVRQRMVPRIPPAAEAIANVRITPEARLNSYA